MGKPLPNIIYPLLFILTVIAYGFYYAPYGINDTDGGFITAYAWRVIQGEWPYQDFIYVRPPITIWWRSLELWLLPESWEILAERWMFYLKLAGYSYLAATILLKSPLRWWLALLGFIVSVHNYPAAAWHTVDGIFFSVLAFWLLFNRRWMIGAALAVVLAVLCKQSFYPLLPLFLLVVALTRSWRGLLTAMISIAGFGLIFYSVLKQYGIWEAFVPMVSGATSSGQAIERGLWDYFRLHPLLWGLGASLLPFFFVKKSKYFPWLMGAFVIALSATYLWAIEQRQDFTAPVGQTRLLFLIAIAYTFFSLIKGTLSSGWNFITTAGNAYLKLLSLLAISWMSAISWGYNFPVLFATPYLFVLLLMVKNHAPSLFPKRNWQLNILLVLFLLACFRYAYEYVYRDGERSELTYHLGEVFPKLQHIYSDQATFEKYQELKALHDRYGDDFKTLPSFPLSNYLTNTTSPLPIDWVFNSETNGKNEKLYEQIRKRTTYFFLEKEAEQTIQKNRKYEVSKYVWDNLDRVGETKYFYIYH